jgi:hypothetical protein
VAQIGLFRALLIEQPLESIKHGHEKPSN